MAAPNNSYPLQTHPRQNSSSFRRSPASSEEGNQLNSRTSPPSLPIFSSSDDTTVSLLSSKSSNLSSSGGGSGKSCSRSGCGSKKQNLTSSKRTVDTKALSKKAQLENDSMVYLDGPQVYTCGQCRTHLTSHDDIISKSFHGRHGRAYLFDQCVNITTGPQEDRFLITGLHSVSDIFCKRCNHMVGWTYAKAYEPSQKYKEGKFIIEKINLHMEESDYYDVEKPAGERGDKWRVRSMSWGSERSMGSSSYGDGGMYSPKGYNMRNSGRDIGIGSPGASSRVFGGEGLMGASPSSPRLNSSSNLSSSFTNHHNLRPPQTPPPRRTQNRIPPASPRSPSDIVYEYQNDD